MRKSNWLYDFEIRYKNRSIDTEKNFNSLFNAINKMAEKYDMMLVALMDTVSS